MAKFSELHSFGKFGECLRDLPGILEARNEVQDELRGMCSMLRGSKSPGLMGGVDGSVLSLWT